LEEVASLMTGKEQNEERAWDDEQGKSSEYKAYDMRQEEVNRMDNKANSMEVSNTVGEVQMAEGVGEPAGWVSQLVER
jgi:hypothetical protein